MTLEELLQQYVEYSGRMDPAEKNAFNGVKEELGERIADIAVAEEYGRVPRERSVPRRGKPGLGKGPPVFDRVYELEPGKYLYAAEGEFIVVEAKFGESQLSRSNFNRRYLVDRGKMIRLPTRAQVVQLDADWLRARIRELARREAEAAAAQGIVLKESLAEQLERAAKQGKLRVLEVRGSVDVKDGRVVRINREVVDHTAAVKANYRTGRRPPIDAEGRFARQESLDKLYLDRATVKARRDAEALRRAQGRLETAKKRLRDAERRLANAPNTTTDLARRKLRTAIDEKTQLVAARQGAVDAAEDVAKRSERIRKYHRDARDRSANLRKTEQTMKDRLRRNALPSATPSNVGGEVIPHSARATEGTGVADRGAGRAVTVETVAKSTEVVQATGRAAKAAKASRVRSIARFALKSSKVVMRAGKFIFRIVELANPILDLLMLVDIADYLVGWFQREKREERAEWKRITHFLSAEGASVKLPPYGMQYTIAFGDTISRLAQWALAREGAPGNFLDWLNKWNAEPAWSGFVYATVTVNLERQALLYNVEDDPYPVMYYLNGGLQVSLSHNPPPNAKQSGPPLDVGEGDERNHRTGKREYSYDPEFNVPVEIRLVTVRYSYPNPVLTPFDFILAKSNSLLGDIVAFISKYDENVFAGMETRIEIVPGVTALEMFAEYDFQPPLHGPLIKWSLVAIHQAVDLLSTHGTDRGDERRPNPPQKHNAGHSRRSQVLRHLATTPGPGSRSFHQIALYLNQILQDENPRHLIASRDKSLDDLKAETLCELAMEIHADIKRTLAALRKPATGLEFNYEGPPSA